MDASTLCSLLGSIAPFDDDSLDDLHGKAIAAERKLRAVFADKPEHPSVLDPFAGMIDVFKAPPILRKARMRRVGVHPNSLKETHVMALSPEQRIRSGKPCIVESHHVFRRNFDILTDNILNNLHTWENVAVAGGAVLASLLPVPNETAEALHDRYSLLYPSSDIDIFLYGMGKRKARKTITKIILDIVDCVPTFVPCIRTENSIMLHIPSPGRSIQIIMHIYRTPAEILSAFDVDACCFLYTGTKVYGTARAILACIRRIVIVDLTRHGPNYELRLIKYALRGFEIYVPFLTREIVNPKIYDRSVYSSEGLAFLLAMEKLLEGRVTIPGKLELFNAHYRVLVAAYDNASSAAGPEVTALRQASHLLEGSQASMLLTGPIMVITRAMRSLMSFKKGTLAVSVVSSDTSVKDWVKGAYVTDNYHT